MAARGLTESHEMVRRESEGVVWYTFAALDDIPWLRHAFTTRLGGTSEPPFDSLNMGLHVGDNPERVQCNRTRALRALEMDASRLVVGEQVHGTSVRVVREAEAGYGAYSHDTALAGVDSVITNVPAVPLGSLYADCVPILLVDRVSRAVGLAHAGWRGALGRIGSRAVQAMGEAYGSKPGDIVVGIGPHIGACCFVVGEDLLEAFRGQFSSVAGPQLSLAGCVEEQLLDVGCLESNLLLAGMCTACHTDVFFSHRAERGLTGRMASIIEIVE